MEIHRECSNGSRKCIDKEDNNYCHGNGQCCIDGRLDEKDTSYKTCVCDVNYEPPHCESRILESRINKFEQTEALVAFSAVLGVIVITVFIVLVVLQIKYYRRRRKRLHQLADGDHDLDKISKIDSSDKKTVKRVMSQPGYSWRESVRRVHSKASHKFRSTMSRSVPDDLFQIGLAKSKLNPSANQSADGKSDVRVVVTQRCFSADADLGHGQTVSQRKNKTANESSRPSVIQIPTEETNRMEDTVK